MLGFMLFLVSLAVAWRWRPSSDDFRVYLSQYHKSVAKPASNLSRFLPSFLRSDQNDPSRLSFKHQDYLIFRYACCQTLSIELLK